RFGWIECVGIADRSAYDLNAHIQATGTDMYALRKFDEPKTTEVKKIVPNMGVMGPLFKGKAGKIKTILENMEVKDIKKISVNVDGETIEIPENCYEIIQKKEKLTGEKFVPHVIEPSFGIDRILYCILEHNYHEGKKKGEEYRIIKFNSVISPIKVGVLPLISDDKLIKIANEIDKNLRDAGIKTYYDDSGSIGRRYARMDEVGTPFCVTVDHDSLKDNTVTVRDRDTTKQIRIKIDNIIGHIKDKII
ncbi:MAG: glycine--tRNA ligase, partial [Thermoplasmatales archaeon]